MGLHHTGVEVLGREYSYGSGGSGIFDGPPKVAPGARFRCQLEMGVFEGGPDELQKALDELRHDNGFGPDQYNLIRRNCNHFCNALVWRLLRRPIPAYINRLANVGECCSCLLPKQLLEDSPVGGNNNSSSSSSSFAVPTSATMNRGNGGTATNAFSGKGHSLVGGNDTNSSESVGLLSRWSSTTKTASTASSSSGSTSDDLTDRRERARKAALARLERNQQQQQQLQPTNSKES
jgi:hypothetical protein